MALSPQAIEFLKENMGVTIVATVSEFGVINLSPRFILDITENSLIFVSVLPNKTLYNLKKNSKVCISKWDNEVKGNVRFLKILGTAKNHTSGDIYEKFSKVVQGMGFPKPLAVTEVFVDKYEFYGG